MSPLVQMLAFDAPRLALPDDLMRDIAVVLKNSILDNIKNQQQADGSPLKRNSPRYQDYKARVGWTWNGAVLSLVAGEHRFVRPDLWSAEWDGEGLRAKLTIEPRDAEGLKDIVVSVQVKGYTGWFAPGEKAIEAVRARLKSWLKEELRKVARRR